MVVGSLTAGFLGLPESTADVSSFYLSVFFSYPTSTTSLLPESPAYTVYSCAG